MKNIDIVRSQSARPPPIKRYPFVGRSAYRSNEVIPEGRSSNDSEPLKINNRTNLSSSSSETDCEVAHEYSAA
jgi:hypothetical protein